MTNPRSRVLATPALVVLASCVSSCGPSSKRDLSNIPQRQITFSDMCQLQEYFDQRNAARTARFRTEGEQIEETEETEPDEHGRTARRTVGSGTYIVSDRRARGRLQQMVEAEYNRIPPQSFGVRDDQHVLVRAEWWQSGQVRRLRPDRSVEIESAAGILRLPFNPCIGEFLFGAEVYAMRRWALDSEAARARGEPAPDMPDFSRVDPDPATASATGDGGVSSDGGEAGLAASIDANVIDTMSSPPLDAGAVGSGSEPPVDAGVTDTRTPEASTRDAPRDAPGARHRS